MADVLEAFGIEVPSDWVKKPSVDLLPEMPVPQTQRTIENNTTDTNGMSEDEKRLAKILFSPEELEEIQKMEPVGFFEALKGKSGFDFIPFAGTAKDIAQSGFDLNMIDKAKAGDTAAMQYLTDKMREDLKMQMRGTTIFGDIGNILHYAPGFIGEFAIATATFGSSAGATVASKTAQVGAKAAVSAGKKAVMQQVLKKSAVGLATSGATVSAMPQQVARSYLDRRIAGTIKMTDKGEMLLQEMEESPALTTLKALGDTWVSVASEMAGGALTHAAGKALSPIISKSGIGTGAHKLAEIVNAKIPVKVKDGLLRAVKKIKPDADISRMLSDKVYFNGVLGEIGEERLEGVLSVALGLNDEEKSTVDKYLDAIFISPSQFAAELGAFSMIGGLSHAGIRVYNGLRLKGFTKEQALKTLQNMTETQRDEASAKIGTNNYWDEYSEPPALLNISEIALSQDVPNFKEGANERGVVSGEELQGEYKPTGGAPIVVWERLDGRKEVITGRHRLDLARRNGMEQIFAQVVKEENGFTKEMATMFDAEQNIRDEKGSVKDYVRYFEKTDYDAQTARALGLLSRQKGKEGFAVGRLASPELRASFMNGQIASSKASVIAEVVPVTGVSEAEADVNAKLQRVGLKNAKSMNVSELKGFMQILKRQGVTEAQSGEQGDLFGFDDAFLNEQKDIVRQVNRDKEGIKAQINAVKGALRNPEAAEKMGLKFEMTPEGIQQKVYELNAELTTLDNFATNHELYQHYLNKVRFEADIKRVIEAAEKSKGAKTTVNETADLGVIRPEISALLKQYGIDIEGYRNEINSSFVNHVLNRHSNEKTEEAREQKAISEKDLYSLNDVVQSPDFIVVEDARNTNTALVFVKNMPDGSTILVENVGNKKKRLLAKTMRIKRRAISGDELSTLYPTSETLPSVNIIIDTSDIKSNTETEGPVVDDESQSALFDMPAGQYATTADATISKIASRAERISRPFMEREESKADMWKRRWLDNLNPIKVFGDKIYKQARLFAGVGGKIEMMLKDKTRDLTGKETGEGLLPIVKDFKTEFGVSQNKAEQDLGDYLKAMRYTQDLTPREGVYVSDQQISESLDNLSRLQNEYGENFIRFGQYAERIYEYQSRVLYLLVESGMKSKEWYDRTLQENPHYVPFKRVLPEDMIRITQSSVKNAKGRGVGGGRNVIKQLKGSDLEERNVFASIVTNTAEIISNAYRNDITRKIANMRNQFPALIRQKLPERASFDKGLREQIKKGIELLGGKYERTNQRLSPGGGVYGAFGVYLPLENKIKEKIGSDAALVHEFGHMLDHKLDFGKKVFGDEKSDGVIHEELKALARERLGTDLKVEDGRFVNEQKQPAKNVEEYLYSEPELIANLYDAYVNAPELLERYAPRAKKRVDSFVSLSGKKWLQDIHRTLDVGFETMYGELDRAKNVIGYRSNGMKRYIEVHEDLYQALKGEDAETLGAVMTVFSKFTSLLRWGATQANLTFAVVRNPIRDTFTARMQTDVGFIPVLDTLRGSFNVLRQADVYKEWKAAGGSFDSFMQINENSKKNPYEELFNNSFKFRQLNPFYWTERLGGLFEEGTRVGVYAKARKQGLSMDESAFVSRNATLDFSRGGSESKQINRIVPFFNASLQGTAAMYDRFQKDKLGFMLRGIAWLTLPSLALSAYYMYWASEDERREYAEIPQWQKDLFWNVKLNGHWLTIPKPAGYGPLFASLPQAFAEGTLSDDGVDWADVALNVFSNMVPLSDVSSIVSVPLRVALELQSNYNFYFRKDIVPAYLVGVLPEEQYTDRTSEFFKMVGKYTGLSPIKMEYVANALLGGLAKDGLFVFDIWAKKNSPEKELGEIPVIRGIVAREPIGWSSKSVQRFSDEFKDLSKVYKTLKLEERQGGNEAEEFIKKHEKELDKYFSVQGLDAEIRSLSQELNTVSSDENLSPAEKKETMRLLRQEMTKTAQEALEVLKEE